jgi:hypothetical protein
MYNKIILETKLRKIETKRQLRLTESFLLKESFDISSYLPGEEGSLKNKISSGVANGAAETAVKKSAEIGIRRLLSKYGIKAIPGIGSIAAAISALAEGSLFINDLYNFSQRLQSVSGVELEGISSILGEYTLVDASSEDLNRIADALEASNISVQEATELYDLYNQAITRFKYFLVDLCFAVKELSAGISLGVALGISVLPVETAFKHLLFETHKLINSVKNKAPDILITVLEAIGKANHVLPIIGFLNDNERIVAMSRIDDAMSSLAERGSREVGLDAIQSSALGSKRAYDIANAAGDAIASSIDNIKFENNQALLRLQILSGIN